MNKEISVENAASGRFKRGLLAIVLGVAVGMATLGGQKVLPIELNFLANSGAVWLIPAYFLALYFRQKPLPSALDCVVCLLGCVLGYYGLEAAVNGHAFTVGGRMLVWIACAVLAGGVFGVGASLSHGPAGWPQSLGRNLLPAVFLAEGLSKAIHFPMYAHMAAAIVLQILIGIGLYFAVERRDWANRMPLISLAALTALGVAGYEVLMQIV